MRRNLELVLEHLRPLAPLSWAPPDNLHITTKFIGPWGQDRLPELKSALESLSPRGPLELKVSGFGWFENPHNPRALFAGIASRESLSQLKQDVETALEPLGLPRENRPYRPHVTLARIKGPQDLAALRQAIAALPSSDFGVMSATKHLLYKSEPGESASVYRVIGEFPL